MHEKTQLSAATNVPVEKVNNWFINARVRRKWKGGAAGGGVGAAAGAALYGGEGRPTGEVGASYEGFPVSGSGSGSGSGSAAGGGPDEAGQGQGGGVGAGAGRR
jgi:hypothetical protein